VVLLPGCALLPHDHVPADLLRDRILPPPELRSNSLPPPSELPKELAKQETRPHARLGFGNPDSEPAADETPEGGLPLATLTLEEAIDLAFRASPNLEVMEQRIAQAEAGRTISFAEFLPQATASYRPITGDSKTNLYALPTLPTYIGNVSLPDASQSFGMAELNVQWILWDFGRSAGRYGQAVTQVDIARLQYARARQTVAFGVTAAYLQSLQARALRIVAAEAVRRAEAVLAPDATPYLYFVAKNDGTHQFSKTRAEHEAAVNKYQR